MWFIIRGTGLVLAFLFLHRLPNGTPPRLCSKFLSAKTNLTGLLSVRPISATVTHNGTRVQRFAVPWRAILATTSTQNHSKTTAASRKPAFKTHVTNDGRFSRYMNSARTRNNKQNGRTPNAAEFRTVHHAGHMDRTTETGSASQTVITVCRRQAHPSPTPARSQWNRKKIQNVSFMTSTIAPCRHCWRRICDVGN